MSSSRSTVVVLILIGVVSALAGVFGNVAASALPDGWLSRIACFRGPVAYDALVAVAKTSDFSPAKPSSLKRLFGGNERVREEEKSEVSPAALDAALHDLVDRGLLHRDLQTNRFDLHPIVRRYAYDRLGGDARGETHARLRDYFAAVPPPGKPQTLDDLAPVIELYHHTVAAGQIDDAWRLYDDRLRQSLYYTLSEYQIDIDLLNTLPHDSEGLPLLSNARAMTWKLIYQGMSCEKIGCLNEASDFFKKAISLNETDLGFRPDLASGLTAYSTLCCEMGRLLEATTAIQRAIGIFRFFEDQNWNGISHRSFGRTLTVRGDLEHALREFNVAESAYQTAPAHFVHGMIVLLLYESELFLLLRQPVRARDLIWRAQELCKAEPMTREICLVELLSGVVLFTFLKDSPVGQAPDHSLLQQVETHLSNALVSSQRQDLMEIEARALLWMGKVRAYNQHMDDALRLAEEALLITERSGYVLQGADVRLFLAQLNLDAGDRAAALEHARLARQLAACDGPPDYTYKVAYEEAGAMVEALGAIHE